MKKKNRIFLLLRKLKYFLSKLNVEVEHTKKDELYDTHTHLFVYRINEVLFLRFSFKVFLRY